MSPDELIQGAQGRVTGGIYATRGSITRSIVRPSRAGNTSTAWYIFIDSTEDV
jgi:hypothetical protein